MCRADAARSRCRGSVGAGPIQSRPSAHRRHVGPDGMPVHASGHRPAARAGPRMDTGSEPRQKERLAAKIQNRRSLADGLASITRLRIPRRAADGRPLPCTRSRGREAGAALGGTTWPGRRRSSDVVAHEDQVAENAQHGNGAAECPRAAPSAMSAPDSATKSPSPCRRAAGGPGTMNTTSLVSSSRRHEVAAGSAPSRSRQLADGAARPRGHHAAAFTSPRRASASAQTSEPGRRDKYGLRRLQYMADEGAEARAFVLVGEGCLGRHH